MRIAGIYSFNNGEQVVQSRYAELLHEISECIIWIDAESCKSKESQEKTMHGQMLFSPVELNKQFKAYLYPNGWNSVRVQCEYPTNFYIDGYKPKQLRKGAFREMDFVKQKLGVEV